MSTEEEKFHPENVRRIATNKCVEFDPSNPQHVKIANKVRRAKNCSKEPRKLVMINPVTTFSKKISPMKPVK